MVRTLIIKTLLVFSLIFLTANLHLFFLHPAGPSLRFTLMIYPPTLFWHNKMYWFLVTEICFGWGRHASREVPPFTSGILFVFWYLLSPFFIIENLIKDPDIPKKGGNSQYFFPTWVIFLWIPRFCHIPNLTLRCWHMENSSGPASLQKVYFGFGALFSVLQRSRTKSPAKASLSWGSSLSFLSIK